MNTVAMAAVPPDVMSYMSAYTAGTCRDAADVKLQTCIGGIPAATDRSPELFNLIADGISFDVR